MRVYDEIGYAIQEETVPGVWQEKIITRNYYIDILKNMSRIQETETLNDNLNVDNKLSIVADPFAYQNFSSMRYIKWLGIKWKINSIEVARPRLILNVGGVYNEQTSGVP